MKSIFVLVLVYAVGGNLLRSSSSSSNSNMNGTHGMNDKYMNGTSNWNMHDMNSTNNWNMSDKNGMNNWNMHDRNDTDNWNMHDMNGTNNWNMGDKNGMNNWNMHDRNDTDNWNMHDRNGTDNWNIYNRNRNGGNNWNMRDRNNQNGWDMHDMDDMDNETMGSGECEASYNFGGGIFNSKKFFKEITNMCIDVRFPREVYKRSKQCLKEEGKRSGIFDNMMNGKFPSKEELGKFIESSCTCQLRGGGINNLQRDLNMENLLKYTMYDRWGGDEEEKENLKQEMTTCFNQAQGSGYQKLTEYHKCLTKFYLKECEEKDDEPGIILIETAKLLTIGEESKCAPVRLPKDMNQVREKCFQEAKTNMKKMPETSASSSSSHTSTSTNNMGGSDQDMRSMQVLKHFWMEYMMKAVECFLTELKMFDTQKKTVDVNGMTEYVQKFEGWDKISKERDEVIGAIKECGKVYEQDSDMMDSHEDHGSNHNHNMRNNNMMNNNMMNNSMNNNNNMMNNHMNNGMMNNTEHREMKMLMKKQAKFDRCFTPKFAEICGINNEVSNFFYPMMDPEFMGEVFKAFRETCGKEAEAMLMWLKTKLTEN